MWVDKRGSWIYNVVFGGFALPHIWSRVLTVTALSCVVTWLYKHTEWAHWSLTTAPFVMLGLPLGIFLGFRNSASYDRFWEGRKIWGGLVNVTRTISRQFLTLADTAPGATAGERAELAAWQDDCVRRVVQYVHALRHHLRDQDPFRRLARDLEADELDRLRKEENVPLALVHALGERLREARRRGWVDAIQQDRIDGSLTEIVALQGMCERIKATPIPHSYNVLMHRITAVYCALLPFGLADSIGWEAPIVVLGISYALFGLDAIGDEIEQPFGTDLNDLPLSAIARTIEINLRRRLGDDDVPAPYAPKDSVLR